MFKLSKNIAFTMAEVLMVIGIIGVVSALTLPNLNNKSDEQVNVAKAKKVYSDLSTSVDRVALKYGDTKRDSNTFSVANVTKYLNASMKTKGSGATYWYQSGDCANNAVALSDGSAYCVIEVPSTNYNKDIYKNIMIDVDGSKKGLNTIGADVFYATLFIPKDTTEPIELKPWKNDSNTTFTNTRKPAEKDYLHWVTLYDNEDYRECPDKLYYQNVTTCK
ncbi:type II secretion system protein [bacterium]|nr:type II secretion system protein [bacterium]